MSPAYTIPEEKPRRTLIIVVAIIAAVLIGGFFYLLLRGTLGGGSQTARLENSIRPGTPDWDKYSKLIALDDPVADQSKRALGDWVMTLRTTVRNFTGRTIIGLEMRGTVVDHNGKPVKERTLVIVPGRRDAIEPNKTLQVGINVEGMTDKDDRAGIKMEVTAFRLQ